jgi:hypothetical protein
MRMNMISISIYLSLMVGMSPAEKVSDCFASAISSAKVTEKTKWLLQGLKCVEQEVKDDSDRVDVGQVYLLYMGLLASDIDDDVKLHVCRLAVFVKFSDAEYRLALQLMKAYQNSPEPEPLPSGGVFTGPSRSRASVVKSYIEQFVQTRSQ